MTRMEVMEAAVVMILIIFWLVGLTALAIWAAHEVLP